MFLWFFASCLVLQTLAVQEAAHKIKLGLNGTLYWTIDYESKVVNLEVHSKWNKLHNEWFAVGFSDYGEIQPSDLCIFWVDWKGNKHLQDTFVDDKGQVTVDYYQDCSDFRFRKLNDTLVFYLTRKFDTCDTKDYVIEDGTTHIVWAKGKGPLYRLDKMNIKSAYVNGFERTTLLAYQGPVPRHPKDTFQLQVTANKNPVPKQETLYYCKVIKLPDRFQNKHHIIQYEPALDDQSGNLIHHMEVFHCLAASGEEIPPYEGSCFSGDRPEKTKVCKQVMAAWAMGAKPFHFPEEAGLPIGGPDFNRYIMLEIHYHNPNLVEGAIDSSGIRLFITPTLRKHDSGIMELGLEYNDKMAIPPGEESFTLKGHCIEACTAVGIPTSGITVFASQLHTHLTGVRVFTKHIRQGIELPELNRDNHYSQHFQEIRQLKRKIHVLPGDALITTCEYNTLDRNNVTLTGFSITDEMCVNYIQYYPRTDLEVCKSSIPDHTLHSYFQSMQQWERQKTSESYGISDNYRSIDWTPIRSLYLQHLYDTSPISMQCNQSNGARFPGYWEDIPQSQIILPLLVERDDDCNLSY